MQGDFAVFLLALALMLFVLAITGAIADKLAARAVSDKPTARKNKPVKPTRKLVRIYPDGREEVIY